MCVCRVCVWFRRASHVAIAWLLQRIRGPDPSCMSASCFLPGRWQGANELWCFARGPSLYQCVLHRLHGVCLCRMFTRFFCRRQRKFSVLQLWVGRKYLPLHHNGCGWSLFRRHFAGAGLASFVLSAQGKERWKKREKEEKIIIPTTNIKISADITFLSFFNCRL